MKSEKTLSKSNTFVSRRDASRFGVGVIERRARSTLPTFERRPEVIGNLEAYVRAMAHVEADATLRIGDGDLRP